ncbi:reverse transcriptase domain-containing protein [Tanacetum coccineum]
MSTSTTSNSKPLILDQLEFGVTGTIVVMIYRMWDVNSATGWYLSTDFIVSDEKPNKDDFHVLRFAHFIVEMDGDTIVRKSSVRPDGFARYPFQLVEFDSLEPTNNKYLIGAVPMPVKLYNSKPYSVYQYPAVKDNSYFIPVLKQFKSDDSGIELAKELLPAYSTGAKAGTLENLLMWARNRKYDAITFHCAMRIDKIRTKRGWNYPSCGGEKCMKGNLDRKHGRFWCDSCHSYVDYPVLRWEEEEMGLPLALANIVGTVHTLELKSNSYYEHANYKSFTCWSIVLEEALDESGSSRTLAAAGVPKTGVFVPLTTSSSVTTPSKPGEQKKPRSEERHDSDGEESFVPDSKTKGSDVGCSSEAGKGEGWCWIAWNEYHKFRQYGSAIKEAARVSTTAKFNVVRGLNK